MSSRITMKRTTLAPDLVASKSDFRAEVRPEIWPEINGDLLSEGALESTCILRLPKVTDIRSGCWVDCYVKTAASRPQPFAQSLTGWVSGKVGKLAR